MAYATPAVYKAFREAERNVVRERIAEIARQHLRALGDNCSCGWQWNGGAGGHYSDHLASVVTAALFGVSETNP